MLVLSRQKGERILIGDDIEIEVVKIGPLAVRLGITAPRELNILRSELKTSYPCPSEETESERTHDDSSPNDNSPEPV